MCIRDRSCVDLFTSCAHFRWHQTNWHFGASCPGHFRTSTCSTFTKYNVKCTYLCICIYLYQLMYAMYMCISKHLNVSLFSYCDVSYCVLFGAVSIIIVNCLSIFLLSIIIVNVLGIFLLSIIIVNFLGILPFVLLCNTAYYALSVTLLLLNLLDFFNYCTMLLTMSLLPCIIVIILIMFYHTFKPLDYYYILFGEH